MIIKLPFAVDNNNVLLLSVHRGIIEIGKGLMVNADKQHHDKLEPKTKYNGPLPGSKWPLDLSAVQVPTHPSLNRTHFTNDNNIMEKHMIRQGKDKFFDVTDEENNSLIQEVYPIFASLTQETVHSSASSVRVPDESLRMEDNDSLSDECTNHLLSTGGSVTELETNQIEDTHDSLHGTDEFENNGSACGEAELLSTTPIFNLSGSSNNKENAHCGISLAEEDVSMMSAGDLEAKGFLGEEEFWEMAEDLESNEPEIKCIIINLVEALLHTANNFVNPSPMDVVNIFSALHSNPVTTAKVTQMVFKEFPPGITTNAQKSNCIFDLEHCPNSFGEIETE
ncbi:hypothetical protein PILCRDRAFT_84332 [Piloderma croceum F 1598]|uniref:Uncharacterized protein n=1 Tax=Piloderma croceum (strain F 1598) TaxID=765440 RepID=A0A0C3GHV9_PILCF|nr:hypothetical protein PILCRDRAFT_84332 [Piloderma croceum F 1598]